MSGAGIGALVSPARAVAATTPAAPRAPGGERDAPEPAADAEHGFAATLERAQAQRKPTAVAKPGPRPPSADKASAEPVSGSAPREPAEAPARAEDAAEAAEPAEAVDTDDANAVADPGPTRTPADLPPADLRSLLPGWPAAAAPDGVASDDAALPLEALSRRSAGAAKTATTRDTGTAAFGSTAARRASTLPPAAAEPAPARAASAADVPAERAAAPAADKPAVLPALAAVQASSTPAWAAPAGPRDAAASPAPMPAAPHAHEAHLAAAIDSPAFAPALAQQVSWLVRDGVQQARLSLNPAEMGPVAVQIVIDGTQARVDFSAEFAATRQAIEASLPTLAAALQDSGLTLSGGGVFDGRPRHGAAPPAPAAAHGARAQDTGQGVALGGASAPVRAARGLVDLVA